MSRRLLMGKGFAHGAGGSWTPIKLPNLVAWYKADAGVFKDAGVTPAGNGDNVVQWNDQSGNGYHLTQTNASHQPTFATAGYNSKKAVVFTASGAQQLIATPVAIGTASPFSAFAVCQMTNNSSSNGRVLAYAPTGGPDYVNGGGVLISRNGTAQQAQTYRSGASAVQNITYSTSMHIGFVADGTNTTPYLNNVAGTPASDNSAFTTGGDLGVGGAMNGGGVSAFNSNWDGPVAEVVLTNAAMSAGDRAALEAYFTARW